MNDILDQLRAESGLSGLIAQRFITESTSNKPIQAPEGRKETPHEIATFCRP